MKPLSSTDGFTEEVDTLVFGTSVGLIVGFVSVLVVAPDRVQLVLSQTSEFTLAAFGGLSQLLILLAIGFFVALAVSPWGNTTLGGPDAEPRFGLPTYVSMLFTAGIAAGIVFWGPAEAIFHYETVPPTVGAASQSASAGIGALQYTIFHWGISAWTAYLTLGLPIAYFVYNRGAPLRMSAILTPWSRTDGYGAVAVDILAVVATVGGMTATIGLVSEQFLTGIEYEWGVDVGTVAVVLFIVALVVVFTSSVVTGLHRGIRRLSLVTVGGMILLGTLIFVLGPTGYILDAGGAATGAYIRQFVAMSTTTGGWERDWTLYYWSWWFSWAPFVGLFIARISKGRTVRELVVAGILVPTVATMAWFLVVGGSAIGFQRAGEADILAVTTEVGVAAAAFPLFDALPFGNLLLVCFLALIVVFLVTSADSSTQSVTFLTTTRNETPSSRLRITWGIIQAVLACVVIIVGGGEMLRSAAVLTGGPVMVLSVLAVWGLCSDIYYNKNGSYRTQ